MAVPGISESCKIDLGLVGQTINGGDKTGPYFSVVGYRKFIAICTDGASVVNKVTKVEWLQAKDTSGTSAKPVKQSNDGSGTESKAETTAAAAKLTRVTECTITCSSTANGETVTINGITYTGHTDTTIKSQRQFSVATGNNETAEELEKCLKDPTYGITHLGISVSCSNAAITLRATGDKTTLTVETDAIAHIVPAITEQILYSEIDIDDLDINGGFVYVAPKVSKAGNGIVSVAVLRQVGNYNPPTQHVAAGVKI